MHGMILVVHSDPVRRAALADAARRAGLAVLEAADAEGVDARFEPDALVIDGALSAAERSRIEGRIGPVPALILGTQSEAAVIAELGALVRSSGSKLVRLGPVTVDLRRRVATRDGRAVGLTDKEAALLAWMIANPHRTVTRAELLRDVWGYHSASVTRAVDVTVRRLREKIEVDPSRPEFLLTEHGEGYRFEPEVDLPEVVATLHQANDRLQAAVSAASPEPAAVAEAAVLSLVGLGALSGAERLALGPYLDQRRLAAGEVLIREDEPGDVFYLVVEGRMAVTHRDLPLRELGPGDQLGELGFTGSARRTATVTALVATTVVGLSRARFELFVRNEPQTGLRVAMALLETVGDRLRDLTERLASS